MILISNDFWHKIKMYNFEPYNVLLSIATNIAVLLMTASVLQTHILNTDFFFNTDTKTPRYVANRPKNTKI